MSETPTVLLIDDGELREARDLLDDLEVEYQHIQGSKHRGLLPDPDKLLITTSRLAIALQCRRTAGGDEDRATWIAFLHGDSRTQRQVLERAGFDFMVRQPVHPAALRLLLVRALYRGPESRRAGRVAFGYEVSMKLKLRNHKATLTDLSPGGCRLLSSKVLERSQKLVVRIPAEVAGGKRLELPGTVARCGQGEGEGGSEGQSAYGIRFARLSCESRDRLRDLLLAHATGPAVLPESVPQAGKRKEKPAAPHSESREHPRKHFNEKMTAIGGNSRAETYHVLLGRDVSMGGMRIERDPSLKIGDELRLAVQPQGSSESILLEAQVIRDDGTSGLALRFEWLDPETEPNLRELVDELPSIESLHAEAGKPARVLTRMLSTFRRN
ncbi:MAG: PilZ domain-containing protein [bacterium]|nr:PilZ domain-containing protein [bacterium]